MARHCAICKRVIDFDKDIPKTSTVCAECLSITIPCKCGCGSKAHLYGCDGKQRQGYLLYHYSRTSKHKTALAKYRHPSPHKGKKHSPETKAKMSRSRRGSGNSNWKGGLTMQVKGIRRSPEYYQWRRAVLNRDKYTCRLCGSTDNLHAHHKLPIAEHPNEMFNVFNGITLCRTCHERTHLLLEEG